MPSKALISGASGLIGAALLPSLRAHGYAVSRLIRSEPSRTDEIHWDPAHPIAPESVSNFDAVIHLAGESVVARWTKEKKARIRDSRVLGTRHLSEALAKSSKPPRVLISASAIGYYGDRGEEILREESASGTGFLSEVCREWEAATQAASGAGIRVVHIRIGLVLAPTGGALQPMLMPFKFGVGGKIGSGRQWWSWIHIDDLVGTIIHILENDSLHGAVNLVSPEPARNAVFTKLLASVLSRPAIFSMPAFIARLALGEMADEAVLASQRVEPAKLLARGYVFQRPDLKQSLEKIIKKRP
ncbi:MAG TPA: TIGR01777 family oxidoreductase [Terriglobales bacterium]|nr:TIGR01777 family oxidoreductase [Terriglobales bacterium]